MHNDASEIRVKPLLDLIERRFDLRLEGTVEHLREVQAHYAEKREMYLRQYGEAGALSRTEYAKAFMISEAARMMILREILPRPKTKKKRK
jgi:hypothetical protein